MRCSVPLRLVLVVHYLLFVPPVIFSQVLKTSSNRSNVVLIGHIGAVSALPNYEKILDLSRKELLDDGTLGEDFDIEIISRNGCGEAFEGVAAAADLYHVEHVNAFLGPYCNAELGWRKRSAWGAFKSGEEVVRKTKNARLRAHLFGSTVLLALTYASESWALRRQDEHAICVAQRCKERRMLGVTRFIQARDGIRSSELRRQSKIRDAVALAKLSKIRWAGHVMRFRDDRWTRAVTDWIPRNVRRTPGRPPLRWSDFFVKSLNDRFDALRVPRASRTHWSTMARDRDKCRRCWRPLEQIDDHRDGRNLLFLEMLPVATMANFWNLPIIAYMATANVLSNKKVYKTLVRTSLRTMNTIAESTAAFIKHYKWRKVSLVSNIGASAFEKLSAFEPVLKRYGIVVTRKILFDESATASDMINGGQLEEIRSNSRIVIVMFSSTKDLTSAFREATAKYGLSEAEFVFIFPWLQEGANGASPFVGSDGESLARIRRLYSNCILVSL
ncbi:unnamed protein product [Nippostrongylus brasiliensis]|uniref:ANF_receptor domain-containing protein n=1 Tax=Nippostrongylus brasiliensis TaxID=27835 RepID=A0A0N4XEC4_NIPBR|nr:unnamed protein product [Nippostrongylus brasiliensis]